MKIFYFDQSHAREISKFESKAACITGVLRNVEISSIGCLHLRSGGNLGFHPAVVNQIFMVVSGQGWVTGRDRVRVSIQSGQAAFWTAGENHESGTEDGLVAIVIEGNGIDPTNFLKEKK